MDEPKILKPTAEELKTILEEHRKWRASDGASGARANLADANLARANLADANLARANLARANLADANLADANLADANLAGIRDDFYKVLNAAPAEVLGLLDALRAGRVDGSSYVGDCACLVGTIAHVRGVRFDAIPELVPNSERAAERWFLAIKQGDTPQNNQVAAIVEKWILDWKPPVVEAAPVAAPAVAE